MWAGQFINQLRDAFLQHHQAFPATLRRPFRVTHPPQFGVFWPFILNVFPSMSLKVTKVALSQMGMGRDGEIFIFGHSLGSVECTAQIAGINCMNLFLSQGFGKLLRLPATMIIQRDIDLPLYAGIDIPSGFSMANSQYAGDFHGLKFKSHFCADTKNGAK
jgi:hypothetical protein